MHFGRYGNIMSLYSDFLQIHSDDMQILVHFSPIFRRSNTEFSGKCAGESSR